VLLASMVASLFPLGLDGSASSRIRRRKSRRGAGR
jgi:hypothetical protein